MVAQDPEQVFQRTKGKLSFFMTQPQKSHSISSTIYYWSKWSQAHANSRGGDIYPQLLLGQGKNNLCPCHTTTIPSVSRNLDNFLITLITHDFSAIFLPLLSFCLWKHWHNAEQESIPFLKWNFQLSCILCSCNKGIATPSAGLWVFLSILSATSSWPLYNLLMSLPGVSRSRENQF